MYADCFLTVTENSRSREVFLMVTDHVPFGGKKAEKTFYSLATEQSCPCRKVILF